MVVASIVGILAGIATPIYLDFRERARIFVAISDIKGIETAIDNYYAENNAYPDSLADIGMDAARDPWGSPYRYLRIDGANVKGKGKSVGKLRKDHNNVPVNSDYDLYSMGADGKSQTPFTAKASRDDVVRAYDGSYYGKVADL